MLFYEMKYRFIIFSIISIFFFNPIIGQHQIHQRAQKFQELAFIHFRQGDTTNAREFALKAIEKDNSFATPWVLLGNIYEMQSKFVEAAHAYQQALRIDSVQFPDLFYVLAEIEVELKEFDQAIHHILRYLSIGKASVKQKTMAEYLLKTAKFRKDAYQNPVEFIPKNLGVSLNSENDEYVNSMSTDERSMYLTKKVNLGLDPLGRRRYEENIYQTIFDSLEWSVPNLILFDDKEMRGLGGASVSPNNRYLFLTVCNQDGDRGCDLYYAKISNGVPNHPKNLGSIVNSSSWDSQPSFSSDGKTLFFASKRKGGFGGSDIWISQLDNQGRFQKPFNAGEVINTAGDEMAPLIHYDAKTLYFSSTGHIGMGGYDLFISRKLSDDSWDIPQNLGYPINTAADEINLIVAPDGESAFISSDQSEGFGGFDIYRFALTDSVRPSPVTYVQGLIIDSETGEKLEAGVELALLPDGKVFTRSASDEADGTFLVALPLNKLIAFSVEKQGYLMHTEHYNTYEKGTKAKPVQIEIPLKRISIGEKLILNNIFFETDKFELMEASFPELKKVIQLMKDNPGIVIEISGHTDDVGTDQYNQVLSEKRAQSVMNYLLQFISKDRLSAKGYGLDQPIDTNETEAARSMNRRTEIRILKN